MTTDQGLSQGWSGSPGSIPLTAPDCARNNGGRCPPVRHCRPHPSGLAPSMATSPATSADVASPGLPDALGRFGAFGGRFVPETLIDALNQLAEAYERIKHDPGFWAE